jgi:hypothetical protein
MISWSERGKSDEEGVSIVLWDISHQLLKLSYL